MYVCKCKYNQHRVWRYSLPSKISFLQYPKRDVSIYMYVHTCKYIYECVCLYVNQQMEIEGKSIMPNNEIKMKKK